MDYGMEHCVRNEVPTHMKVRLLGTPGFDSFILQCVSVHLKSSAKAHS